MIIWESLHHAQAQASARSYCRSLILFPKTTRVIKLRCPLRNTAAKHHQGFQLQSKLPMIVMSLVDRQVNWLAQGNDCDYCYKDQGGDATGNHTPARHRRHRYVQVQSCWQAMLHLAIYICWAAKNSCHVTGTKVARIIPWKPSRKDLGHLSGPAPFQSTSRQCDWR